MSNMTEYESIPNAHFLLSALRSMGYTEETAIADIIDNSISAGASRIDINFDWDKERIIVFDNGKGMNKENLLDAMQIGSTDLLLERDENDLGRFGLGMKMASFSLGKQLFVFSKTDSEYANACWDLDKVEKLGWKIIVLDDEATEQVECRDILKDYNTGTVVIIQHLDKVIDEQNLEKSRNKFYRMIKKIKSHVSLVFHRFIEEDGLQIYVNGNRIEAWNPFIIENRATQELSSEECFEHDKTVIIEPYILPHKTKFASKEEYDKAAGPKGWYHHQGYYIYRNRRLIVYGTWFGILKKEIAFNLARIKLDIYCESDFDWKIDIKKSKATPPVYITDLLEKTALLATERSAKVYNSRGVYSKKTKSNQDINLSCVWEQHKNAQGLYSFRLNKKHPVLFELEKQLSIEQKEMLDAYLCLVENLSPVMLSGVTDCMRTASETEDAVNREKEKIVFKLKKLIRIFKKQEFEESEIVDTLEQMYNNKSMNELIKRAIMEEKND